MTVTILVALAVCCAVSAPDKDDVADQESGSGSAQAIRDLIAWLGNDRTNRGNVVEQPFASIALTEHDANRANALLWDDHANRIREERRAEMDARVLQIGELKMPFDYTVFGDAPEGGRSLFVSMHGGGGAPKRVNDQQWENQKRLYTLKEGIYVAPRAPTDTWNLWHQGHIDAFFSRLIEDMVICEGVNPDRVYLMGYSAGGDGVFQLAPRMADRFAAAAMMAGHPNETSPLGLRNVPFTLHMGANDSAYKRNEVAAEWKQSLASLHQQDPDGYDHWVEIHEGKGHWMDRQDAAAIPWMASRTRCSFPNRVVWKQDDVTHGRYYWLAVEKHDERARTLVIASIDGQTIVIEHSDVPRLRIGLSDRMLNLSEPVLITAADGSELFRGTVARTIAVLASTMVECQDPNLAVAAEVVVNPDATGL
jgi:poly(3-hydroxybutyrate) depolymerase